jgi:HEAT repeat protein
LTEALDDPHRGQQAALALGYIRDPRAVEPLRAAMLESPDPEMRRAAAWALGAIGDPGAGNALLLARAHEPEDEQEAPEPELPLDDAPRFDPRSLSSLDFDGLAESYDIAVEAWLSAGRMGDFEHEARWREVAAAVVEEARGRLAGGQEPDEPAPRQAGLLNRRRLDRRRAQLREACAQGESPAAS